MPNKCWCGKMHPRGDSRNGKVKHFVVNWKLYQLKQDEKGVVEKD